MSIPVSNSISKSDPEIRTVRIAIDGPSASGKSTVARRVAGKLGYVYVDSGSLYRGVVWLALKEGVDPSDEDKISDMLAEIEVKFFLVDNAVCFSVNGDKPVAELRSVAVNGSVSLVAAMSEVRDMVVGWLRSMVRFGNLVIEGRDIGTVVFPDAEHKFYLDASPEERARRRSVEMLGDEDSAEVRRSLERRDTIDSTREIAPLAVAGDAVVIDSTSMSIDETVTMILAGIETC